MGYPKHGAVRVTIAPNQLEWMTAHTALVDPNGPTYQTTRIGDSRVEWGPHDGPFLGETRPRHKVIASYGWPEPDWDGGKSGGGGHSDH